MLSRSEEYRKFFSWNVSILFLLAVFLATKPQAETASSLNYFLVKMAGYVLIIQATLGRIWCSIYITGQKNKVLSQHGPYSLCRNPSYIFSFLGVVGIAMGAQSLVLLALVIPAFWFYYYFVIKSEERRLLEIFGQEYAEYCSRVNRLLPRFKGYWSKSEIKIDPRLASRSIVDAGWFLWFLILLEMLKPIKAYALSNPTLHSILQYLHFLSGVS